MNWTSQAMSYATPKHLFVVGRRGGFSLIETAMALMIVGLAVGGMLQMLASGTKTNMGGHEMTTAINLTKNIREVASGLAYRDPTNPASANTNKFNLAAANDIWDLDGLVLSPPVDCTGKAMDMYANWTQKITVQTVSPNDFNSVRPSDPTIPTALITVTILHQNQTVYTTSWLACAPDSPTGP
jgi:hypothetical protein